MKHYIVYDAEGNIIKTVGCMEYDIALNSVGYSHIEGVADSLVHYIDVENGMVNVKVSMALSVSTNNILAGSGTATISNIPAGTSVEITGPVNATEVVNDGVVEFATDTVGEYRLVFRHVQYITTEVTINAD